MPTTSQGTLRSSSTKRSRLGKSSTAQGAETLACISISPHERWNMRSEKTPCSRVTWL